jgi:hypothetical protein
VAAVSLFSVVMGSCPDFLLNIMKCSSPTFLRKKKEKKFRETHDQLLDALTVIVVLTVLSSTVLHCVSLMIWLHALTFKLSRP